MIHLAILAMLSLVPPVEAETCTASWYSSREGSGSATASGRKLNDGELTAAHKTLPFGSRVKVRNRANGRTVTVTKRWQSSACTSISFPDGSGTSLVGRGSLGKALLPRR